MIDFRSPYHSNKLEPRGHANMVFKTKAHVGFSHWAHIMCDPTHNTWQTIERFALLKDSEKRTARFRAARPTMEKICTWPSSFPHIDVGPDM